MVQTIEIEPKKHVKVKESEDIDEITNVLYDLLYVPDPQLKPKIIERVTKYLKEKLSEELYKIKVFIESLPESLTL